MHSLAHSVGQEFRRLIEAGEGPVVVAVSGGLDSVVLLHLLRFHAGTELQVAHLDHGMRRDSRRDAHWVRGLARAWELPFQSEEARDLRSEDDARRARYAFLEGVADRVGARCIATAHHADDQVETVLFRLMRGSGLDGLAGIPARRGRIVRPLLAVTRAELAAYAAHHRLGYREDPTNLSRAYARNRIRHDLLPALDRIWPEARSSLLRLAEHAAGARRGWNSVLAEIEKRVVTAEDTGFIELARQQLLEYHPEIRARLLRRLLARFGAAPGRTGTAAATTFISAGASGSALQLSHARLERAFDTIRLTDTERNRPHRIDQPLVIEAAGSGTGVTILGGQTFEVEWSARTTEAAHGAAAIALSTANFPLTIRGWRPGDRIHLPYGSKKLKKLFVEKRLERRRRHSVPVIVDANDKVLCVVGVARAADVAPDGGPVLCIMVNHGQSG